MKHLKTYMFKPPVQYIEVIFWMNNFFSLFLLSVLGWHRLITLCRFQVYISMTYDLYVALCAHHPQSNHLPSPYVWPLYPSLPLGPFPLVTTILPSVSVSFVFLVWSFVAFRFISHMSEIIWLSTFSVWLISLSVLFSRSIHTFANGSVVFS